MISDSTYLFNVRLSEKKKIIDPKILLKQNYMLMIESKSLDPKTCVCIAFTYENINWSFLYVYEPNRTIYQTMWDVEAHQNAMEDVKLEDTREGFVYHTLMAISVAAKLMNPKLILPYSVLINLSFYIYS